MVDDFQDQEIIKIADVDKKEYKKLGEDKLFKFECTVEGQQLRLGLKEINCYSPYYYEVFYTLEELYNMKDFFRAKTGLEEIQSNLIALFSRKTTKLESLENDSKIKISSPNNAKVYIYDRVGTLLDTVYPPSSGRVYRTIQ